LGHEGDRFAGKPLILGAQVIPKIVADIQQCADVWTG